MWISVVSRDFFINSLPIIFEISLDKRFCIKYISLFFPLKTRYLSSFVLIMYTYSCNILNFYQYFIINVHIFYHCTHDFYQLFVILLNYCHIYLRNKWMILFKLIVVFNLFCFNISVVNYIWGKK
jgi:hypothetical protein